LKALIDQVVATSPQWFEHGFVAGGRASLDRIAQYYSALDGRGDFPPVRCNAPWMSAVLEPDGNLRPCFFHPVYEKAGDDLGDALNSSTAIAFRKSLNVATDTTCARCVCSLNVPLTRSV
jgi:Fe-coproporphyrin III synthase